MNVISSGAGETAAVERLLCFVLCNAWEALENHSLREESSDYTVVKSSHSDSHDSISSPSGTL